MNSKKLTIALLLILAAIALYLCWLVVGAFLQPLLTAIVLVVAFLPLHIRVERQVRGRSWPALISLLIIILAVLIPVGIVVTTATVELNGLVTSVKQHSAESGGLNAYVQSQLDRAIAWAGNYVDLSQVDVRTQILTRLQAASGNLMKSVGGVLGNIGALLFDFLLVLVIMFFLFRDGRNIHATVTRILPLADTQIERLTVGVTDTIQASMYGIMAVAIAQAVLQGLAFWAVGIPAPVMWGVITAFASLIPIVGATIIWIPAMIWLLAIGSWGKALFLLAWCAGIVGTADNFLRPYVMSGRVEMHPLLLFFALLGGVQAFGMIGLFAGPVILAVTNTLFQLIGEELHAQGVMTGQDA